MCLHLRLRQVVKRAAQALGFICRGHATSSAVMAPAVDALLGLRTSKSEEVLFAAGEALCFAFGGRPGTGPRLRVRVVLPECCCPATSVYG